jgi:hypothetical protein
MPYEYMNSDQDILIELHGLTIQALLVIFISMKYLMVHHKQ